MAGSELSREVHSGVRPTCEEQSLWTEFANKLESVRCDGRGAWGDAGMEETAPSQIIGAQDKESRAMFSMTP